MKNKPPIFLCNLALILTVVVITLGAFTRAVDAGLGCPDWPTCYGHLWVPNSAEEIARANRNFSATPVETHKTWPEQIHRIFAGSLGLVIVALALACWQAKRARKLSLLLIGVVVIQALFGMWTVTLKLWPQVVTGHLLGGFTTLSLLWLMRQRLSGYSWQPLTNNLLGLKIFAPLLLVAVIVQITLGGWTSSNYAALACPDFPRCQNQWLPEADFAKGFDISQEIGPNYLGGQLTNHARIAIHFAHRLGAIVLSALCLVVVVLLAGSGSCAARRWSLLLAVGLLLQIGLGVSNIIWSLPLGLAVAHNSGGALLLLLIVAINHRIALQQRVCNSNVTENLEERAA